MTRPVGRVEVWAPGGGSALYTINDAVGIYYKELITDGIGNFNFACYSHKDFSGTYTYPNINLGDTVKIWLNYDTIVGDPNFIGVVTKRSGPILTETGWLRRIAGLSQGEILLRRFKTNKYYTGVGASTIVTEWATDLSLGTGDITVDATPVTLEVRTKTYFDLLREISDYWYDAGTQIKKDFWVDLNGDLVWKTRPFRTTGVESFSMSDFLADPLVERELDAVKNNIIVYGVAEKPIPADKDAWTDSLDDWSASAGTLSLGAPPIVGANTIKCYTGGAADTCTFKRVIPRQTIRTLSTVYFWKAFFGVISTAQFRLLAPDTSNYFEADLGTVGAGTQEFKTFALGPNNEYHATANPDGVWTKTGTPNWWDIQGIQFHVVHTTNDWYDHVDGCYFYPERWSGTATDATSQTLYEQRDVEVTDDKLHSDGDCQKRAETLLYQLKDPPIQVTINVQGNDNVLPGDRLTVTIPSEAITAQPYDVLAVENLFDLENWVTTATMVNSANWRVPLQLRQHIEMRRRLRELSMDERGIG